MELFYWWVSLIGSIISIISAVCSMYNLTLVKRIKNSIFFRIKAKDYIHSLKSYSQDIVDTLDAEYNINRTELNEKVLMVKASILLYKIPSEEKSLNEQVKGTLASIRLYTRKYRKRKDTADDVRDVKTQLTTLIYYIETTHERYNMGVN